MLDEVVRLSGPRLPPGAPAEDIALFARTLGVTLPPLLVGLLERANGGETILARAEEPIVPHDVAAHTPAALWERAFVDITAWGYDARPFYGRLFPIGDDYSGEVIAIDLKSAPAYRVVCTAAHAAGSLGAFHEIAPSFLEFIKDSIDEVKKDAAPTPLTTPLTPEDEAAVEPWRALLTARGMSTQATRLPDESNQPQLWLTVAGAPAPFRFRLEKSSVPQAAFHPLLFATGAAPTVVFLRNGALVRETYENAIRASEAGGRVSLLPLERCRQTKNASDVQIFETPLALSSQRHARAYLAVAVVLLRDAQVHSLVFRLNGLHDAAHADASIRKLLAIGFDWVR